MNHSDRPWQQTGEHVEGSLAGSEYSFKAGSVAKAITLALLLNHYEQRSSELQRSLDKATDVIERVALEYPSVVQPCGCGNNEACPSCEIACVLEQWQTEQNEAAMSD